MMKASFKARGQAGLDRLDQDETQRALQRVRGEGAAEGRRGEDRGGESRDDQVSRRRQALGDWKNGEQIAQEGRGKQFTDDPAGPVGANCYACHQLAPQELSYGTIGPSLYQFGKLRGYTDETQQVRLRQDLQRRGVRRLLEHAALRPQGHPDRAADQGRRRAADGSRSRPSTSERARAARESPRFLQALAAAAARPACRSTPPRRAQRRRRRRRRALRRCAPFGNVQPAALHRLPRAAAARLLPRAERQPRRRRGARASRRTSSAKRCCKRFGIAPRHARRARVHVSRLRRAPRSATAQVGGFAHLATLVKRLRAARPGALLLDGGDTLAGLGDGAVDARRRTWSTRSKLLGVDIMTGHWEFTYGAERVQAGRRAATSRAASNSSRRTCSTADFGDPVFKPYVMREINGVPVAIIGQAFPVHADRQPALLRARLDLRHPGGGAAEGRRRGARARARRSWCCCRTTAWTSTSSSRRACAGIDAILGGHTHDGVPQPTLVDQPRRHARSSPTPAATASSSACSTSTCSDGSVARLSLPAAAGVRATCCRRIAAMAALSSSVRAPFAAKLDEKLAVTEGLLYRRGNFNGTFDQLILDALMAEKDARDRVLAGIPLGHDAAARRGDHASST